MRILVVEDEPRIAADIRSGLEAANYVVDTSRDGDDASATGSDPETFRLPGAGLRTLRLSAADLLAPSGPTPRDSCACRAVPCARSLDVRR